MIIKILVYIYILLCSTTFVLAMTTLMYIIDTFATIDRCLSVKISFIISFAIAMLPLASGIIEIIGFKERDDWYVGDN